MTNPTPEQKDRMREFVKDLRANEKKAKRKMRKHDGGRCCLAVALDTAVRLGYVVPTWYTEVHDELPPDSMNDFYGWESMNTSTEESPLRVPVLRVLAEPCPFPASCLNDGHNCRERSHKEIADLFEQQYRLNQEPDATTEA